MCLKTRARCRSTGTKRSCGTSVRNFIHFTRLAKPRTGQDVQRRFDRSHHSAGRESYMDTTIHTWPDFLTPALLHIPAKEHRYVSTDYYSATILRIDLLFLSALCFKLLCFISLSYRKHNILRFLTVLWTKQAIWKCQMSLFSGAATISWFRENFLIINQSFCIGNK